MRASHASLEDRRPRPEYPPVSAANGITIVQSAATQFNSTADTSTATLSLTLATPTAPGNALIIVVGTFSGTHFTATTNTSTVFTERIYNTYISLFDAFTVTTGTTTVTVNTSPNTASTDYGFTVLEVNGLTGFDVANTRTGESPSDAGPLQTTYANDLIIVGANVYNGTNTVTATFNAPYTALPTNTVFNNPTFSAYVNVAAIGNYSGGFTTNVSGAANYCVMGSYKG